MVRYKTIEHERVSDAPFIGALISSIDCSFNCKNCFNQVVKSYPTKRMSAENIIKEVKNNPFNKGIILGGLEWTLQANEAIKLIGTALKNELEVILYTGLDEINFAAQNVDLYKLPIYIKFGCYDETQKDDKYYSYGVKLSSKNQYIKKMWRTK